ncbi:hypothetical protein BCR44DRAFT_1430631 [Catenaria anguillulae PL171]|uniref:Uncharacterized protein n=1 Tax=Catenaria anguillulae PL171 TaxID=765915 RepID=A0A1Y2HRH3_9FUNG|nr:hypothetical protein BCR44DRAFT_1430631 [Catenaria anguillulae PL171]
MDLVLHIVPLLANAVIKVFHLRLIEISRSPNLSLVLPTTVLKPDNAPQPQSPFSSTVTSLSAPAAQLAIFVASLYITIIGHVVGIVHTLIVRKRAWTLSSLVIIKAALFTFDMTVLGVVQRRRQLCIHYWHIRMALQGRVFVIDDEPAGLSAGGGNRARVSSSSSAESMLVQTARRKTVQPVAIAVFGTFTLYSSIVLIHLAGWYGHGSMGVFDNFFFPGVGSPEIKSPAGLMRGQTGEGVALATVSPTTPTSGIGWIAMPTATSTRFTSASTPASLTTSALPTLATPTTPAEFSAKALPASSPGGDETDLGKTVDEISRNCINQFNSPSRRKHFIALIVVNLLLNYLPGALVSICYWMWILLSASRVLHTEPHVFPAAVARQPTPHRSVSPSTAEARSRLMEPLHKLDYSEYLDEDAESPRPAPSRRTSGNMRLLMDQSHPPIGTASHIESSDGAPSQGRPCLDSLGSPAVPSMSPLPRLSMLVTESMPSSVSDGAWADAEDNAGSASYSSRDGLDTASPWSPLNAAMRQRGGQSGLQSDVGDGEDAEERRGRARSPSRSENDCLTCPRHRQTIACLHLEEELMAPRSRSASPCLTDLRHGHGLLLCTCDGSGRAGRHRVHPAALSNQRTRRSRSRPRSRTQSVLLSDIEKPKGPTWPMQSIPAPLRPRSGDVVNARRQSVEVVIPLPPSRASVRRVSDSL